MRILVTSDLDRTLIFSNRTKLNDVLYTCIEQLDGQDLSYMSNNTIEILRNVMNEVEFVPVTTRSLAQYKRITIFQHELPPTYAITSNGGHVLINGEIDPFWQQHITTQMNALSLQHQDLCTSFANHLQDTAILRTHDVEGLFYVSIIDEETYDYQNFISLHQQLADVNWTCHLQGRKLYMLPCFLTKGAAVSYIKKKAVYDWHAAAGDSQLDISMLEIADQYFIPQHAELAQSSQLTIMKESSSQFTETFLNDVLSKKNEEAIVKNKL